MRRLRTAVVLVTWLAIPATADARLCDYLPIACVYEGAPFTIKVVDAETGQPLAGVHALAEWQQYGTYGSGGPLMVQDAVSGAEGVLTFPAWGPVSGSRVGLDSPRDPLVTLFKSGYRARLIDNDVGDVPRESTAKHRRFGQDGATFALEPFRGTPEEWAAELQKVAFPHMPAGDDALERFHIPYGHRARLVWAERDRLPARFSERGQIFWQLEGLLSRLDEAQP